MCLFLNSLGWEHSGRIPELTRFNPKILAPYLNRIRLDPDGLIHNQFTRSHVVLPSVPGAGDCDSLKLPLSQGTAPMQTSVIHCVELVSYVSDSLGQPIHLKLADRTCRNFIYSRRSHKTHSLTPSPDSRDS